MGRNAWTKGTWGKGTWGKGTWGSAKRGAVRRSARAPDVLVIDLERPVGRSRDRVRLASLLQNSETRGRYSGDGHSCSRPKADLDRTGVVAERPHRIGRCRAVPRLDPPPRSDPGPRCRLVVGARHHGAHHRALAGRAGVSTQHALLLADRRPADARAHLHERHARLRRRHGRRARRAAAAPGAGGQVRLQPRAVRARDIRADRHRASGRHHRPGLRLDHVGRRARRVADRERADDRADPRRDRADRGQRLARPGATDVRPGLRRSRSSARRWRSSAASSGSSVPRRRPCC